MQEGLRTVRCHENKKINIKKMKVLFTYTIIIFFCTCAKNNSKANTVEINSKTNISLEKDTNENFEDKISILMQSLNVGEKPEDYNNYIILLKDSIEHYRANLIIDLKKKSRKNKQILDLIKSIEENKNHFNENLTLESDIVSKSYGNSSYGFNSPRYQYTNGYAVYSLWHHLSFIKSINSQIRENIIDYEE